MQTAGLNYVNWPALMEAADYSFKETGVRYEHIGYEGDHEFLIAEYDNEAEAQAAFDACDFRDQALDRYPVHSYVHNKTGHIMTVDEANEIRALFTDIQDRAAN